MIGKDAREIAVGVAVLLALSGVLVLSSLGGRVKPVAGYVLKATFNRVDGIGIGGDVRLGGIKVGAVESQELDDRYRAVLTLRIGRDVRLPADTSAAIHTDGLFGSKFISLDPGGDERILGPGGVIAFTQDSVLVDELLELIIAQGKARRAGDKGHSSGGAK